MKEKKNLIILLPNFKFGGAGNSVFSLINHLKKDEFSITVICIGICDYKALFNKKVKLFELENKSLLFLFPKIISIIRELKNNHKTNIIYSNHHYANIYSIILKIFFKNLKIIGVERTCIYELSKYFSLKDFTKKKIIKFLITNIYKFSDHIISNTIYTKKEINKFSKNNVTQIYSPSITKIKKFKKKKIISKVNLLWIGRLSKEKGCEDLIRSTKYINFETNIYILGDGIEYSYLKKLKDKYLKKNVNLYFKKYIKKTDSYFAKSHVLINTSFFEGSNNSIIQGINNNLFILASDVPGGNKELLNNKEFGLLYKKNNPYDLAMKLNIIIKKYDQYQLKLKSKKKFLPYFTKNISNKKTLEIINKF